MNLDQAIKKIINDHGADILKERRLVSMLSDLQAFGQLPYAANMLKLIYANGYGTKIHQLYNNQDQTEIAAFLSELRNKLGFDIDMLGKVLYAFSLPVKRARKQKQDPSNQNVSLNNMQVITWNKNSKEYKDEYGGIYSYPNAEIFYKLTNDLIPFYSIRIGTKVISPSAFEIWDDEDCTWISTQIEEVVIPSTVIKIGTNPFNGCRDLCKVDTENNECFTSNNCMLTDVRDKRLISYYGHDFKILIPDYVKIIGRYSFFHSTIHSVNVSQQVTTIENSAFSDCKSLEYVIIQSATTKIEQYAFWKCESLKRLELPSNSCMRGLENIFCENTDIICYI